MTGNTQAKIRDLDLSWQDPVLEALPENIKIMIKGIPTSLRQDMEEIRIRENRPLMVHSHCRDYFICSNGRVTSHFDAAYHPTAEDTRNILQLISDFSIYAFDEEIKNGYITLRGGHRVGMAGRVVLDRGKIRTMKYINSFNIRISKEVLGSADKIIPYMTSGSEVYHTLILSPPQMGKTTLLRDICRKLSDGFSGFNGIKVGIVDERSEIAGCWKGIPQRRVGIRTDVLDSCPKAEGIMVMIRSMSPAVIVTDEIGRVEDVEAIQEALNAGIRIIASAHAADLKDALERPILSRLLNCRIFDRIGVLGDSMGVGTLEKVYRGDDFTQLSNKAER